MPKKNRSNLASPNQIKSPCRLDSLDEWFKNEALALNNSVEYELIMYVFNNLQCFVKFPLHSLLLLDDVIRDGYHTYPDVIRQRAKALNIEVDTRFNGPAVLAYQIAGGIRPPRYGSNNAWSVHHIYSGKYEYINRNMTTHAAKEGKHFTQSAGLVAIHPIADQMCDEYPFFSWYLRAKAFQMFKYDPDGVFSEGKIDINGFATH